MEIKELYELEYKVNKNKDFIKLLDDEFIKRNNSFGYYIFNKKRYKYEKMIETKNVYKDKIKIKMLFLKKIFNKQYMFKNCEDLLNFALFNNKKSVTKFKYKKY